MKKYFEKRFKFLGRVYIFRRRVYKSRPIELIRGSVFNAFHVCKYSLVWERDYPERQVGSNFAD